MNFGIIADGNRRWARQEGCATKEGHAKGFSVIKDEVFPVLYESEDCQALTVYAFSTENWKREVFEVKYLMNLYENMLIEWLPELIEKKVRFVHAGRKDRLPKPLMDILEAAEKKTDSFKNFTIYLCLDYGAQDEIVRCIKAGMTVEDMTKALEVPSLDIILRTGGERRLSNFCLWQAAYAEFFFLDEFLPALGKADILKILETFKNRDRRKGA